MAIGPFLNPLVRIDGVDLSDHARSVTINKEAEELDATAFNAAGTKAMRRGLITGSFEVEFFQDQASQKVADTLGPLMDTGDNFFVYIQTDRDDAVSTTNKAYQGVCILTNYQPLAAEVGQLSMTTVTFPLYEGSILEIESGTYS